MKTILLNICVIVLLSTSSAFGQTIPVQDSCLDNMVGNWILQGTIDGKETTHDINIDWVLGHQYIQVKEVSREKESDGKPTYEAIVFITREKRQNQYKCLWLDNTGNGGLSSQAIGLADPNRDTLKFVFKVSDSSAFHTTFIFDKKSGSWQWQMDSMENHSAHPFARVRLTKKE